MVRCHHVHHDVAEVRGAAERSGIATACSIIAVADAFDAMTSDRPYRSATSPEAAIDELRRSSGRQFTPDVVETLSRKVEACRRQGKPVCEPVE
jgi:HD-GYP domain-containing protein (c-di-GMP phosphodiesterase class II)